MKLRKMERKVLLVAFALSLALIVVGCGDSRDTSVTNPNPNTFTPKGTVNGVLRDAVTNVALVGAKVQIMDRVATTDSSGIFTITNVPALMGEGTNEPFNPNAAYPVVIDMAAINAAIAAYNAVATNIVKKALYPSMAYADVMVYYTTLGGDTPVDGFVANITPFVGKLDANVKMQVVNSSLVPQSGATVYLFNASLGTPVQPDTSTGTTWGGSTVAVDGGSPGKLIDTQTTDATGYVTFKNIEAKRNFVVKAIAGANQGWWVAPVLPPPFVVPAAGGASALTAPADNLTDIYGLHQSGYVSTSPEITMVGAYYSAPLVVRTVDGLAPFVTGVVPANLSDFAIPTTPTLDVVFTFSEPMKDTPYTKALTRDASVNGGLYLDVAVNYLGPKAGNIPHTLAWSTDRTTLTVSIPVASMTPASRYNVSILKACDGLGTLGTGTAGRLTDANTNIFVSFTNTSTSFTTAGGFNVAAPVIVKDATSAYTVNWTPVTNAFGYRVYVEAVAGTGFFPVQVNNVALATGVPVAGSLTPLTVATPTTFSLTLLNPAAPYAVNDRVVIGTNVFGRYNVVAGLFAGEKSYNVYVVALNSNGSESEKSNIVLVSETKPAAPTGLARVGTTKTITWSPVTGATQYTIWVQTLVNGKALAGYVAVGTAFDQTFDLSTIVSAAPTALGVPGYVPSGLPYAGTGTSNAAPGNGYILGAKLSYNVAVSTTSPTSTLNSDLGILAVPIDDKSGIALAFAAALVLPPSAAPGGTAAPTGRGAVSGNSAANALAFTQDVIVTVPEQLSYTSAIAAASWGIVQRTAAAFIVGKPAPAGLITVVENTIPTITNIAYNRAAAGGTVTFTLSYAAAGLATTTAWYGAASSVMLQTFAVDLNSNALINQPAAASGDAVGIPLN